MFLPNKFKAFKTVEGFTTVVSTDVSYPFIRIQMEHKGCFASAYSMSFHTRTFRQLKEALRIELRKAHKEHRD